MSKDNKWKDYLLKSGIPLEYEIKEFLDKKMCVSNFEYTYFRKDKSNEITEFSYDIDSSYIKPPHFVDLMIECKYRHESTKWLFLPESYGGPDEIEFTSFMHPNDHFNKDGHFRFSNFPFPLAPLCSKGIELTSQGQNPKTITQAISQLSYAMAERVTNGMYHQIDEVLSKSFNGTIFHNIPIIVTTAELYRIKENSSIDSIKQSGDIEEIATKENCLVIKNKAGVDLENYNLLIFQNFVNEFGKEKLQKKLNSFNKDLDFVLSVIAKHYCPTCFVVVHYSKENNGLENFFSYIDRVIKPDKEIFELIEKNYEESQERLKKLKEKMDEKRKTKS
ncbi:hypothetical protein EZY14_007780 [Kordia sp. TARA_039_SRF]|nr:hypothetical protein EZY14_007780 [Kordia sp. TARA_039_SRF]